MTISTNGTGIRPGIVTSLTLPSSPYEGMLIYETDTNKLKVYSGSSWVEIVDIDTPPGSVLLNTETFTNQSFVTVTGFSADYEWYEIYFSAVRSTTGSTAVLGVLYNGATALNSSYYGGNGRSTYQGTVSAEYNQDNAGDFYGTTVENRYRGNFTMRVFRKQGEQFTYNTTGFNGNTFSGFFGGGFRASTADWDRIRFTGFSGNITGQWSLYGLRK